MTFHIPIYFARRFVAGETPEQAIEAVKKINQDGIAATLDLLGENVETHKQADEAVVEYDRLFQLITTNGIKSGVSLKLTQLGLDLGKEKCIDRMDQILDSAKKHDLFVRIDMEGSHYTQITIDIFQDLLKRHDNVGLVLQAYLHRSAGDAIQFAQHQASIRVCKGAYKEPSSIAYQNMNDIRENYKHMVVSLLMKGSKIGIATHDDILIEWAKKFTKEQNISKSQFEFQMLYGLRRNKAKELVSEGYRVRSYVPYGTQWFPYFYRRLRERKENIFFVLKSLIMD